MKRIQYNGTSSIISRIAYLLNRKAPLPLDGQGDAVWGTNGQVLTTDGQGNTSWTTPQGGGGDVTDVEVNGTSVVNAQGVAEVSVPTKTSDLTNDSGFITNLVNDLANYYTKSQTYTQAEVNALISGIVTLNILVVQALPTQDISTTTIYLVPKQDAGTDDIYDEYLYINNAWELIGTTQIDLSNYVTTTDLSTALADYVTSVGLATILAGYVQSSDLATVATSGSYNDLSDKPTIPTVNDGTLTIQQNGTTLGTFTANQSGNTTVNLTGGGSTYTEGDGIDITNDEISVDTTFTEASTRANIASGDSFSTILGKIKKFFTDLKTVAFTGAYSDLSGTPDLTNVAYKNIDNYFSIQQHFDNKSGTTTSIGATNLIVGNSTPSGTAGNSRGQLLLYGEGSSYAALRSATWSYSRTIDLPDKNGTIALTSDLENASWSNLSMTNVTKYKSLESGNATIKYKRIGLNTYLFKIYVEPVSASVSTFQNVATLPFTASNFQIISIPCLDSTGATLQAQVSGSGFNMRGGTNGKEYISNFVVTV